MSRHLPLYNPTEQRDACGVGFIADRAGRRSHRMVRACGLWSDRSFKTVERSPLGEQLAVEGRKAMRAGATVDLSYPIRNTDRSLGTRLSGEIAELADESRLAPGSINVRLSGNAGQSMGAFLAPGVELRPVGPANDYVGKGMGGGLIAIVPHLEEDRAVPHGAGNACLYGVTGGRLFVAGTVGQRFAVRNSGATAVIEGASDHCCEYMTGGMVVVLGPVGRNVAAGMTGGVLYVWDPDLSAKRHFSDTSPRADRPDDADLAEIRSLIAEHLSETASRRAGDLLERWEEEAANFWVLRAIPPSLPAEVESAGGDVDEPNDVLTQR